MALSDPVAIRVGRYFTQWIAGFRPRDGARQARMLLLLELAFPLESAGVTLVKGDLAANARARRLNAADLHNIRQDLFFAFIYNPPGVPVAAGVLYPFTGLLSPILAAVTLSSLSVLLDAARLRTVRV